MTSLVVTLIVMWHGFLRTIGKIIGLLTGGLFVGYLEGVSAVRDMYKYLNYRRKMSVDRQRKEDEDGQ